jgi:hypothetical protein
MIKKRLLKDRSAFLSLDVILYIFKILFAIIVLTALMVMVKHFIQEDVDIIQAEANLFFYRTLFSKNGLSYFDPITESVHVGILDLEKIHNLNIDGYLNDTIAFGDKDKRHIAARFEIYNSDGDLVKRFYFNQNFFENLYPLISSGRGPSAVQYVEKSLYILLYNKKYHDLLELDNKISSYKLDSATHQSKIIDLTSEKQEILSQTSYDSNSLMPGKLIISVVKQNT